MPTILTVCTGNICRSPAAELLLRLHLGDSVTVVSAGTHALVGRAIPAPMLDALAADRIDGTAHHGRLLTAQLMLEADLVIAMTREHRQLAVQTAPAALRKAFTLAELAAAAGTGAILEGSDPLERLAQVPSAVASHRHVLSGYDLEDVPDPYRRDSDAYRRSYTMIRGGVQEFSRWVHGR